MSEFRELLKKWIWRYIKYNIIGLTVFLLNIALYYLILFPVFGEQSYIIVSVIGGILEFTLITYFNKTRKGVIFDSCPSIEEINRNIQMKNGHPVEKMLNGQPGVTKSA